MSAVVYPRLIGRDIHLHPLVVILAVLAGAELNGIAGVFIAVPLVALTTVAARHWLDWRGKDAEAAVKVCPRPSPADSRGAVPTGCGDRATRTAPPSRWSETKPGDTTSGTPGRGFADFQE